MLTAAMMRTGMVPDLNYCIKKDSISKN
jgi:hypothetical protein